MSEINVNENEIKEATEVNVNEESVNSVVEGLEFGEDMLAEFGSDFSALEEEAAISEDLSGFAKGFPDWDLHPPKV